MNIAETPEITPLHPRMKNYFAPFVAVLWAVTGHAAHAQTLDWGSEVFTDLVDSKGNTLDENTFIFELGAFEAGFMPTEENVGSWLSHWKVFDQASYEQDLGYFTKWSTETDTLRMMDDGTSNSPYETPGSPSFVGLSAYIWIRNGNNPVEGTEWLLTRASNWVFPTATPGCCDNETPVQWSVSDLKTSGADPLWGSHGGVEGPGEHTFTATYGGTGPYVLQTHTFVPEPTSALLAAMAGVLLTTRRRRGAH